MKGDYQCPYCFGTGTKKNIDYIYHNGYTTRVPHSEICTFNRKKLRKIRVEKEE